MSEDKNFFDEQASAAIEQQLQQCTEADLSMVAEKLRAERAKRGVRPNFAEMPAKEANAKSKKEWGFDLGWRD